MGSSDLSGATDRVGRITAAKDTIYNVLTIA